MAVADGDADRIAADQIDAVDERALRRLAEIYDELDPVPPGMVERLQFAVTLEALNAEVAQLQWVEPELTGARTDDLGATEVQTVTFTSESLTTMITITPSGLDEVRVDGWAAPGGGVSVELRVAGGRLQCHHLLAHRCSTVCHAGPDPMLWRWQSSGSRQGLR